MDHFEVPLVGRRGQGKVVLVGAEDADVVADRSFRLDGHGYAITTIDGRTVLLHRLIASAPPGVEVDHINGDKLDCRRDNLRLATRAQNARNQGLVRTNRSGFKGVRLNRSTGRWEARIKVAGRDRYLGLYSDPRDAARAYDAAAVDAFGEFARTNASIDLRRTG